MKGTWILMLAITRILQGLNVEIFRNCIKLVFHPVYGELAHTDTGRHMVHEDMYGAVNLLGKYRRNTSRRNSDVKTFTAEARNCEQCKCLQNEMLLQKRNCSSTSMASVVAFPLSIPCISWCSVSTQGLCTNSAFVKKLLQTHQ